MIRSEFGLSVLIAPLVIGVWCLLYLEAFYAYRIRPGLRKLIIQLSLLLAAFGVFIFQVNLIDRLQPIHNHGKYFFFFVLVQCGGGIIVTFYTLLRERARVRGVPSRDASHTENLTRPNWHAW